MSSFKFKNPETGKWEKIRGGGSASLPVKVNILETICEDITLNDENPSYTLPAEITLDENALYYLDYKAYTSDGTYSDLDSGYQLSKPIDGSVQWMGQEWSWGAVVLTSTGINNTWREPGITAVMSIHKVSIEKTDRLLDEALHTEGAGNIASGCNAHAEGLDNVAGGASSHAEGAGNVASGEVSHAEGGWNVASGDFSHAEGNGSVASGSMSHAEGQETQATGWGSHAEGHGTVAGSSVQHVQGQHNIPDYDGEYLHIVGNGTEDAPSNAHTLDWDGNAWFAGGVYANGNVQGEYLMSNWLQTKADTHQNEAATKFAVLDDEGWVYHRTAEELRGDIGASNVNPNLLINPYFANPVNQRGQTEYTASGHTVDLWKMTYWNATNPKVSVSDTGITMSTENEANVSNTIRLSQTIEKPEKFAGREVTLSCLLGDVTVSSGGARARIYVNGSVFAGVTITNASANNLVLRTATLPDTISSMFVCIEQDANSAGVGAVILNVIAMKLELGNRQTLAHQDADGNWVLNEIPDYGEELRKCQRYFRRLGSNTYGQIGYGLCHIDGVIGVYPSCPTAMRIIPSVTLTGNILAVDPTISGSAAHIKLQLNGTGVNPYTPAETGVIKVNFEAVTGTVTPGRVYVVQAEGGGYVDLSADL